ncbi:MAG: hypothetical protein M3441_13805 [Chloroflexota bacterium]|nr:hypothetical protein [Chloroflexota bacterium]
MNGLGYGKRRALNEMHLIFGCQWANGMLPQIRFVPGESGADGGEYRPGADDWGVTPGVSGPTRLRTSGITQPPIVGLCVRDIFLKFTEAERRTHLTDFLAFSRGLSRYHAWLLRERDPGAEGLALCLHPWETGTDNSPAFDPLVEATRRYVEASDLPVDLFGRADTRHVPGEQRPTDRDYFAYFGLLALFKRLDYSQYDIIESTPFLLQDVLFNSLLAASLLAHARLQAEMVDLLTGGNGEQADRGELLAGAEESRELYERVSGAVRRKLWHPRDGFFYSFDVREGHALPTPTVSGFVPLLSGIASEEQARRLVARLTVPAQFGTPVPIPSTPADGPAFDPVRYWSGPSWPVTNWLVIRGLRERGGHDARLAEAVRRSTLAMIEQGAEADEVRHAAMRLMEANSVGEEFTTPSRRQYRHGWLWDSAIVAASWPMVPIMPEVSVTAANEEDGPTFWEYFHPHTGQTLGAPRMTWTASLYLELLHMGDVSLP